MGDNAIRETDNDAAVSRLSAVDAGYLEDPFASCFVKRRQQRPPLINIGTYLRTWAIDTLVNQLLDANEHSPKQIISLGAGTDTRFFRLSQHAPPARRNALTKYIEVDFPECTTRKIMAIRKHARLSEAIGEDAKLEKGGTALTSEAYTLLPADLRQLEDLAKDLEDRLDPALPTLVLAECVFIYMDPKHSDQILSWLVNRCSKSGLAAVLYDPVGLDDNFGKVMINNLQARGIELRGTAMNTTLAAQIDRLRRVGFTQAFAKDVCTIRKDGIPVEEMQRLSRLEMLDEIEEMDLLLSHYSVAWAFAQGPEGKLGQDFNLKLTRPRRDLHENSPEKGSGTALDT